MTNAIRTLLDWPPNLRLVDLLSTWSHAPYLKRHRLGAIDARVRVVAIAFALASLAWIALDVATLSADLWPYFALSRIFVAVVLIRLAIEPGREPSRARVLTMLAIVLLTLMAIYGLSQFLLANVRLQGWTAINGDLYRALPLVVLACLGVFPLTTVEALVFAAATVGMVIGIHRALLDAHAIELYSMFWVFALITGVYLIGCAIQLYYMMNLAHRASHDPVTAALTRHSGIEVLDLHFRLACAQDVPLSVLFVRARELKSMADQIARGARDRALKELAAKLLALLRLSDVVIQWNDDEFVVILANTPTRGAQLVLGRLVDDWLRTHPEDAPVATGIGLAERKDDGALDWWQLIAFAEKRSRAVQVPGDAAQPQAVSTVRRT